MQNKIKVFLGIFSGLMVALSAGQVGAVPINVTYLWHMHQPIYYPYESLWDTDNYGRFNFSVAGVFDGDRQGAYTAWPKDAVQYGADRGMVNAGAQVSFSGSLAENCNNLWGYLSWNGAYKWARNSLRTEHNNPRLDCVGIAYHHSLMPLTCKETMVMQIRLHKEQYKEIWDTGGTYSKGFWPPECAFAEWMIPALVEEGLEWVIVDNGHLFRTVPDFPWSDASSCRPNPAEIQNPSSSALGSQWVQLQNIWAPTKVLAPWSYQPHYVQWVNPTNGVAQKIIAVPAGRYEGNENGRGGYGAFKPENVWGAHVASVNTDASHPMLLLCHSDGDNYGLKNSDAWHGQHENFLSMCQSNPDFDHMSVQDYLTEFPPSASDVIHVEPGSWIGIDGGTPYFEKWLSSTYVSGECPDRWSWSVLVAAQNRVILAESLENTYTMNDVEWGIGSDTAKAWHYYLNGETSCYWYWDMDRANPWDGNPTRACNMAVAEAAKVLARHPGVDAKGPSIFTPQRTPYNPGGKMWNEATPASSDFEVWSYVDDVSNLGAVELYWRTDKDGQNPIVSVQNETFAGGDEVNNWNTVSMTASWDPTVKGPDNIVPTPTCRARKYAASVTGQHDVLVDYYIHATDGKGNVSRSDIMHVYIGEFNSSNTVPVTFSPSQPQACTNSTLVSIYNATGRSLSSANPVTLVITFNNWAASNEYAMAGTIGGIWRCTNSIPGAATSVWVRFRSGATWDKGSSADWGVSISDCVEPAVMTFNPAAPNGCDPVLISYTPNDGVLKTNAPIYLHVGYNLWQGVVTPDPAMTNHAGTWEYWYDPPVGAYQINACFNDGGPTWDNNNGPNWSVSVINCSSTNAVVAFSPAAPRDCDTLTVTYNAAGRSLAGAPQMYLTATMDNWSSYTSRLMTAAGADLWTLGAAIPEGCQMATVNFRTNTSAGTVDDNAGANWSVSVSACTTGGWSNVRFAPGTPVISGAGTPNNAGDNFDLVTTGGYGGTNKGATGFGDLGRVYVNYDPTNFYVGGYDVNLPEEGAGTNRNAMVVFLEFNTLPYNAEHVWNFTNTAPALLDKLHNVAFTPAVDIAILLGDQWGDGNFREFVFGGDGAPEYGQGVFFLDTRTSNFVPVATARLAQFDGSATTPCSGTWDSAPSRAMTRWECSIPWTTLGASNNIYSVSNCYLSGLIVSPSTSGNDRYISGKYLGRNTTSGTKDDWGSFAYNFVTLNGLEMGRPNVDLNGNGIPDDYEQYYWGGSYTPTATSDFDGDGVSDRNEYYGGTSPKNDRSFFAISESSPVAPQLPGYIMRWYSVPGRTYNLYRGTNLMEFDAFQVVQSNIVATGGEQTGYTDTVNSVRAYYFIATPKPQ